MGSQCLGAPSLEQLRYSRIPVLGGTVEAHYRLRGIRHQGVKALGSQGLNVSVHEGFFTALCHVGPMAMRH